MKDARVSSSETATAATGSQTTTTSAPVTPEEASSRAGPIGPRMRPLNPDIHARVFDDGDTDEPILFRRPRIESQNSDESDERITDVKVYKLGNGKAYHYPKCHHLRRTEVKSHTPLYMCSCVHISGPGSDMDLYVGDDLTLHQSTKCNLYRAVWSADGKIYHKTLAACSQCF